MIIFFRVLFTVVFIGAVVYSVFAYNSPIKMMSWSGFNDCPLINQIWLAGFWPGIVIGLSFATGLWFWLERKRSK